MFNIIFDRFCSLLIATSRTAQMGLGSTQITPLDVIT